MSFDERLLQMAKEEKAHLGWDREEIALVLALFVNAN